MKTALSYITTIILYIYYGILLVSFHIIQVACHKLFGDNSRRKSVDILNCLLTKGLIILGCKIKFNGIENIPTNCPIIIVSNHQSAFDIPPIIHIFKASYPKFISKAALSKNIPSVSYNLIHGKSALIDRQNGSQAIKEILKLGKLIEENNYAACIFPEGTRSKTGKLRKFMPAGISTLLRAAPSAIIVPFVINGHYELTKNGKFPLKFGQKISYTILKPIIPNKRPIEEIIEELHTSISNCLA